MLIAAALFACNQAVLETRPQVFRRLCVQGSAENFFTETLMKRLSTILPLFVLIAAAAFLAACADMQTNDSASGYNSYGGHSGHGGHH